MKQTYLYSAKVNTDRIAVLSVFIGKFSIMNWQLTFFSMLYNKKQLVK